MDPDQTAPKQAPDQTVPKANNVDPDQTVPKQTI